MITKIVTKNAFKGTGDLYHYLYIIINKINKKFYIGRHSDKELVNRYIGSGGRKYQNALKKYGRESFEKRILKCFDSDTEAQEYEAKILNKEFIKRNKTRCYNVALGGKYPSVKGTVVCKNIKTGEISRVYKFEESYINQEVVPINRGIEWSQEQKDKISESLKGHIQSVETKQKRSSSMLGKNKYTRTQEQKDKISESLKGHIQSDESKKRISEKMKNLVWATDEEGRSCRVSEDDEGFRLGKLVRGRIKKSIQRGMTN